MSRETTERIVNVSLYREDHRQEAPAHSVCEVTFDEDGEVTPADLKTAREHGYQLTQRWLEDNDDFEREPGWYYNYAALEALIDSGYVVALDESHLARFSYAFIFELRTRAELERHFQSEGRAERRARYREEQPKHAAFLREMQPILRHLEQGAQER